MIHLVLAQNPAPDVPDPVIFFPPSGAPPWETLPPQVTMLIAFAMVAGAVFIFAPLIRALARRIEGGGRKLESDLTDLRARLEAMEQQAVTSGEFEATDHRMYELEERVEFVERLLARGKEDARGT